MKSLFYTYFCVCRRATELILPFLVVGLAFTAGLAAFMPVVPGDTWINDQSKNKGVRSLDSLLGDQYNMI